MKKAFLFLFLISILTTAQQYQFDVLAKYKITANNNISGETVCYSNSGNGSYFLRIFNNGQHLKAELHDAKSRIKHIFIVNQTKKQDEILFSFAYETSQRLHPVPNYKSTHFVTEEIEKDNDESKILLQIYNNKNARKPAKEYKLAVAASDKNLFPVFRQLIAHPFEYWEGLNLGRKNLVVKRAEYTHVKKYQCIFVLDVLKEVDLMLTLPDKLNYQ